MHRVGFHVPLTDQGWLGGLNYFRNLFRAVLELPGRRIEPVLLCGRNADLSLARDYPQIEIIQTPLLDWRGTSWLLRRIWTRASGRDRALEIFLRRHRISALSHSCTLGRAATLPTLAWIPDFQHLHLPAFFDPRQVTARNREYRENADDATRVLLSSHDALKDLAAFHPPAVEKARVLQFVADIPAVTGAHDASELERRYQFSGPYFFLPNQFWAHKNHWLVVDAIALLRRRGKRVLVLATGNPSDPRQPEQFGRLMAHVEACDVADDFRVLGIVPFSDLAALMRHSVAVINPSRFEGWSTTVEEAKSLGKRVLLSDLAVHREQCPDNPHFFSPERPEELAELMLALWGDDDPLAERDRLQAAAVALPGRRRRFAQTYQEIVLEVLARPQ